MPTLDALAKQGLRYTQFHTAALCSPTRQALLTGRNHHSVGMGSTTELATSAPGVKHWDELSADEKRVAARLMELCRIW